MKKITLSTLAITLIFFFSSCEKEDSSTAIPEDLTMQYFPSDSGLTRYYEIDSVFWDAFTQTRDTVKYDLKEVIAGTFIDNPISSWILFKSFNALC